MGEYATYNGVSIKIGTCESMYYLRYEDRGKVNPQRGSLNPATTDGLFWRLPFPDEDNNGPGNYDEYDRGLRLYRKIEDSRGEHFTRYEDFPAEELAKNPGTLQMSHKCGLLVNMPCYHGARLPDLGPVRTFWNGKSWSIELVHLKNTSEGVLPIIRCRHCGSMWRCTWEEVMPYIPDDVLKNRLAVYAKTVPA